MFILMFNGDFMLKKFYLPLFCSIFVVSTVFTSSALFAGTDFILGISGDLGYAPNSQMNDAVSGYGDAAADSLNTLNSTSAFSGKEEKAGFAIGVDLDAKLLVDSFGIGFSTGYQLGSQSSSVAEASGYSSEQSLTINLSAIAYLATLYYRYVLDEKSFLLIGAGPGYYKSTMTLTEEASGFSSGNFKNEYKYSGSTWGGHFKLEYNAVAGSVDFFAGVTGRYAKVDEFKKDGVTLTSSGKKMEGNFTGVVIYCGAGFMI